MPAIDFEHFEECYAAAGDATVRELERRVLGTDYGANGYTEAAQADRLLAELDLKTGDRLLDVGTGAGWPGLYLAARSGCRAVLADVPVSGLRQAQARARRDGVEVRVAAAAGELLPFRDRSFHAVTHADVLC